MGSEVSVWAGTGTDVGAGTMSLAAVGLLQRLSRWFKPVKLIPRLSSEQVLSLARARAASEGYDAEKLHVVTHRDVDGRIIWHVSEAAIGAVLLVEVADAEGEVTFIGRMPGR